MRWLGVDYGEARVGIAACDPDERLAVPLEIVPANAAFPAIRGIATREDVGGIVLGLPLLMDGTEGAAAAAARKLGSRIARIGRWPVEYEDERLTSVAAARYRSGPADDMAATILLQQFIDRRRYAAQRAEVARQDAAALQAQTGEDRTGETPTAGARPSQPSDETTDA